jgi:hypothetical protein
LRAVQIPAYLEQCFFLVGEWEVEPQTAIRCSNIWAIAMNHELLAHSHFVLSLLTAAEAKAFYAANDEDRRKIGEAALDRYFAPIRAALFDPDWGAAANRAILETITSNMRSLKD